MFFCIPVSMAIAMKREYFTNSPVSYINCLSVYKQRPDLIASPTAAKRRCSQAILQKCIKLPSALRT